MYYFGDSSDSDKSNGDGFIVTHAQLGFLCGICYCESCQAEHLEFSMETGIKPMLNLLLIPRINGMTVSESFMEWKNELTLVGDMHFARLAPGLAASGIINEPQRNNPYDNVDTDAAALLNILESFDPPLPAFHQNLVCGMILMEAIAKDSSQAANANLQGMH